MAKQPSPQPTQSWEICLRVFCFLWAIVGLFQLYPRLYFVAVGTPHFLAVLTTLAGVCLLLKPQSLIRFFLFAAAMAAVDFLKHRIINNHELTIVSIHCAVCIFLLVPKIPGFKLRFAERRDFYLFLIPSLRMTVLAVYFWTLVHKLNSGFVDKEISCAAMQLFNLQNKTLVGLKLSFIPTGDWVRILAIYGTLAIEAAIPIFLLFRKTRVPGVFLGFSLHLILGFGYPNFSVTMYAFLILFLPPEFWVSLVRWWQSASELRRRALKVAQPKTWAKVRRYLEYGAISVAIICLFYPSSQTDPSGWRLHVRLDVGLAVMLLMIAVAISIFSNMRRLDRPTGEALHTAAFWPRGFACVLPLVLFLNGMSPHLGLKSTLSYAMYSNLRTEDGASNHFFLPVEMQIWNFERDLVTIIASTDPVLHDLRMPSWSGARQNPSFANFLLKSPEMEKTWPQPTWKLPYFALRQRISFLASNGNKDIELIYEHRGSVRILRNAEEDPDLNSVPYLARKFLKTRAVPSFSKGCCMW